MQTSNLVAVVVRALPNMLLYLWFAHCFKVYHCEISSIKSFQSRQSWARDNCLASRQRQRDNIIELQREEQFDNEFSNNAKTNNCMA